MQLKDADVLIVDDNPQARTILANMLSEVVASVRHCADGIFGLGRWLETRPHLVFVDFEMPELSGATFIKVLRSQEAVLGSRAAVLMITGHSDRDHVMAALEAGADGFIVKPLDVEDLLERAARALDEVYAAQGASHAYV